MRILVTGAAGFSGSFLVEALASQAGQATVYATTKDEVPEEDRYKNLNWISCDLLSRENVSEALKEARPDQIYHLAAYSSPINSFREPIRAINETSAIQINLYETCLDLNLSPRVLLVSSGQIYGKGTSLPLTEESRIDCSSPYAVAKLCQENLAEYYYKRGIQTIIARPFNHAGPRQQLGFLVADLAYQIALAEAKPDKALIRVGDLSSKRDFTDVRDIALAYIQLMKGGEVNEIYNVCSGKSTAGEEILDRLLKMARSHITVRPDTTRMRPSDIRDLYGNSSKLNKKTGWVPQISLETTLQDTLDYWRQRIKKEGQ